MKVFIFIFFVAIATTHAMKPSYEELEKKLEVLESLQEEHYKVQEDTKNKLKILQQELHATKGNNNCLLYKTSQSNQ